MSSCVFDEKDLEIFFLIDNLIRIFLLLLKKANSDQNSASSLNKLSMIVAGIAKQTTQT